MYLFYAIVLADFASPILLGHGLLQGKSTAILSATKAAAVENESFSCSLRQIDGYWKQYCTNAWKYANTHCYDGCWLAPKQY